MAEILIVDDEPGFTEGIAEFLKLKDHRVAIAANVAEARKDLGRRVPDVLLLDLMLPDGSGLELFDVFAERRPEQIIIITGHSGIKSLIGNMAGDGVRYLQKPIEPRDLLSMLDSYDGSEGSDAESLHFGLMIGESEPMQRVYDIIRKVAPTDSTVFVHGESGTGKELVAEAVHRESGCKGPFMPVNCGALTKELVSSQLFGHEKGSFTGADRKHRGFFERAEGGTLFLDEITEMPLDIQTHLLRALETGKILRVGSETEIDVDTRLIAATNRDPAEAVKEGTLREDLYFRLRVFPVELPPLRDRPGDIRRLAEHFLAGYNASEGTTKNFTKDAIAALEKHHWPGNVRELKHTVHRAYILASGDAVEAPDHFDEAGPAGIEGIRAGRSIADVERDLILATLEHLDGDRKAAAASLGVSQKTLYNRIKQYEAEGHI